MNNELVKKIQDAILDMMKLVKFDNINHRYTKASDGSWLQGVSTISSIVPKDWLSAWGAKEAVKFLGYSDYEGDTKLLEETHRKIMGMNKEEFLALLKEAKGASSRKGKQALVDGKAGHEWLEKYVLAKIRHEKLPQVPQGNLFRPLNQFIGWQEKEIDYWILSEARVAYPEKGYAGTLDALAMMKNGLLALIDFKFASYISPEYYLQTAGYQHTFDPYEISINQRIIVRLPKTLMKEEWNKKEHKYYMIENNIEVQPVKTPYELDRDAFLAALVTKGWCNFIEEDY